jgi:hypothetical protein
MLRNTNHIFVFYSTNVEEYQDKEKLVLSEECELVTLVEVIKGRLEVTTTHVYFFDCSNTRDEGLFILICLITDNIMMKIQGKGLVFHAKYIPCNFDCW